MRRLFFMVAVLALSGSPVGAEDGPSGQKCRAGILGTWFPAELGAERFVGKMVVEPERIWWERDGRWISYETRKTAKGNAYFVPTDDVSDILRYQDGLFFAIRAPARMWDLKDIPCAVELARCAYEDWIIAVVDNETEFEPTNGGPIAGGDVYCGDFGLTPGPSGGELP